MTIRHQPKSEKHPFLSPTTPGLYIDFRNYVIEHVCSALDPKLGPRFWQDKQYWGPKYGREVRGVSNLGKELDLKDKVTQTALIEIIKERQVKALVAKKTVVQVVKWTKQRIESIRKQREVISQKQPQEEIDPQKNSTFVDTGPKSPLAKIREVENG